MPRRERDEELLQILLEAGTSLPEEPAPSRVKARIYSALIRKQQETGPLRSLKQTQAAGHGLCVFEELLQIVPAGESAKSRFFCHVCHARILAERIENAPIFWAQCPYVMFQKR